MECNSTCCYSMWFTHIFPPNDSVDKLQRANVIPPPPPTRQRLSERTDGPHAPTALCAP
jgi:hypothetical protein